NRIDPSIPKNVSLLLYDFPGINDTELNVLTLGGQRDEYLFVGAKNHIYRFQLDQRQSQSTDNPATTVSITANQVGSFSVAHVAFGPFKEEQICRPISGSNSGQPQLEDNIIRTLFSFGPTVFVCGTARCGICTGFLVNDLKNR